MDKPLPLDEAQQPTATSDMTPEDFRRYGHEIVDWIADYLAHMRSYPVLAQTKPGDIRYALPAQPPQGPEAMAAILADFDQLLMPGITHWNSPGFMAYFGITGSGPGILGEMLIGALNVNAMLWRTSPAATELEQVTLDWLLNVAELKRAIDEDIAAGWRPFAVVATVGTTSTTSVDPVPQIADICERYGLWLHVDGAYGGSAAVDPEMRWVLDSCERADSLIVNPHKWLFTPMDCSVFYTRKPDIVKAAFSLVPEYLRSAESAGEDAPVNLMDYGTSLGRRFRSLKLWMIMRYFGQEGLAARIHEHIRLGQLVRQWVEESSDFEIMAPTPFSTVCFRAHPKGMDDETQLELLNEHIMNRINTTGRFFLSHTKLHDQYTIRIAIGNLRTTEEDVRALWGEIQTALADEQAS